MKLQAKHAGFILRLGLGIFMLFWGLAKFITPDVWLKTFQALYGSAGATMLLLIGGAQLVIVPSLFLGWKTRLVAIAGIILYLIMLVPGLDRIFTPFGMTAGVPNLLFYEKILVITAFLALYAIGPGVYGLDAKK